MPIKSSSSRYGHVAVSLHWLSALAVIALLLSGQIMGSINSGARGAILPYHMIFGVFVGILTIGRIVWWLVFDRYPDPSPTLSPLQHKAARAVHLLLYIALAVMVASGIGMIALTGAGPAVFSGGTLPNFTTTPPYAAHAIVSKLLLILAVAHIAAALWHQFIAKDHLINRIRF